MRRATKKTVITGAALLVFAAAAWPLFHGPDSTAEAHEAIASAQAADTGGAASADSARAASSPRTAMAAETAGSTGASGQQPPSPGWYPQPKGTQIQSQDSLSEAQIAIRMVRNAKKGPAQPIPFSHHFHVTMLQMSCEYCHTNSRHSEVAVMPPLATCMGCHRTVGSGLPPIDTLRAYSQRNQPVPWVRVYKIAEFVQFKHQPHLRNDLQCQTCHGPVQDMDRVYKFQADTITEKALTMGWCLECHRQKPQPTDVSTEYELVRKATIPQAPMSGEKPGLYPTVIDQKYAHYRAPVDCTTCHY